MMNDEFYQQFPFWVFELVPDKSSLKKSYKNRRSYDYLCDLKVKNHRGERFNQSLEWIRVQSEN
jgi:hypothetical protein